MKWKGTSTGVLPFDAGNFQFRTRDTTQSARPGKSLPPLADAESTLPEGPIMILTTTRALVAPLGLPASTIGMHLRDTPPFWPLTTLAISA